jgi:hypothetical protein
MDADPTLGTNFLSFDPINLPYADHNIGDNTTTESFNKFIAADPTQYASLISEYNVAQQSWNYEFFDDPASFPGTPLEFFDADAPGVYDIYLKAFDGATEVASVTIQVVVGGGCTITPNPVSVGGTYSVEIGGTIVDSPMAPSEAGIYSPGDAGYDVPAGCGTLVVYDPSAGFVTGGGWIMSPENAMPPAPATIIGTSGDASIDPGAAYGEYYLRYVGNPAPAGYDPDHNYQWATPAIVTPSPENGPVTIEGNIDVDGQVVGQVAMIGLLDRNDLAAGNSSFQRGAYIYVYRNTATTWRIGISDGNQGGEIVQAFVNISDTDLPADGVLNVSFTVDGTADGTTCAVGGATNPAGCMTLELTGGSVSATLTDSYGDIVGNNSASPEFGNGAIPGWDDFLGSNVEYHLTVPTTGGSPAGKATFGFVSKYKKGASVPTGNTQFTFRTGDLSFHSDTYDWLVVTGSNYAKFKGEGTVNGAPAPTGDLYKFQIWAGDNDPDTFRIKIWYEDGGEVVVYDNGMDQGIGGGQIMIQTGKGGKK